MLNFVVCGFYTPSYRNDFERLEISLKLFKLPYHFCEVLPEATWEATTGLKPKVLIKCLKNFPDKDIFYLDADSFVRRPIVGFEQFEGDIGVHFNTCGGKKASHQIRTGTLYIRNNLRSKAFLETWVRAQEGRQNLNDQDSFELAYKEYTNVSFFKLPVSYVKIFDKDDVNPYIEHFQASRRIADEKINSRRSRKHRRNVIASFCVVLSWIFWFCLGRWLI